VIEFCIVVQSRAINATSQVVRASQNTSRHFCSASDDRLAKHPTEYWAIDSSCVYAKANYSLGELIHDHENPVAPKYQRLAAKQIDALQTISCVTQQRQPGRPVRTGIGAKMHSNSPHTGRIACK